jgi:hypothetical protein
MGYSTTRNQQEYRGVGQDAESSFKNTRRMTDFFLLITRIIQTTTQLQAVAQMAALPSSDWPALRMYLSLSLIDFYY